MNLVIIAGKRSVRPLETALKKIGANCNSG